MDLLACIRPKIRAKIASIRSKVQRYIFRGNHFAKEMISVNETWGFVSYPRSLVLVFSLTFQTETFIHIIHIHIIYV